MWENINKIWQRAFEQAWEAFKNNTIPIGAVIVNDKGNIISEGQNMIYNDKGTNALAGTKMAHAEMVAMSQLGRNSQEPNIKQYTLYSTMEPCPMCLGTMVMVGIRNLKYAAGDAHGGATILTQQNEYIKSKNINVEKGDKNMELFQLTIQSAFEHMRDDATREFLLEKWSKDSSQAITLSTQLVEQRYFEDAINNNRPVGEVYNEVIKMGMQIRSKQ